MPMSTVPTRSTPQRNRAVEKGGKSGHVRRIPVTLRTHLFRLSNRAIPNRKDRITPATGVPPAAGVAERYSAFRLPGTIPFSRIMLFLVPYFRT